MIGSNSAETTAAEGFDLARTGAYDEPFAQSAGLLGDAFNGA
jgi:hypothetical protein